MDIWASVMQTFLTTSMVPDMMESMMTTLSKPKTAAAELKAEHEKAQLKMEQDKWVFDRAQELMAKDTSLKLTDAVEQVKAAFN